MIDIFFYRVFFVDNEKLIGLYVIIIGVVFGFLGNGLILSKVEKGEKGDDSMFIFKFVLFCVGFFCVVNFIKLIVYYFFVFNFREGCFWMVVLMKVIIDCDDI